MSSRSIGTRLDDLARTISQEMGAAMWLAQVAQATAGLGHFMTTREVLANFEFESQLGDNLVVRGPVGVCGLITPWNWPVNQIACKVAPAFAAGCTMVLKPSEVAPLNAVIFAEIMDEAGVPAGVFNLVNGDGVNVGQPLASHPDVDMMSFTGSTRAGIEVAHRGSADRQARGAGARWGSRPTSSSTMRTSKRSSPVTSSGMCTNSGQSCNAPTRMLVPSSRMDEAAKIAADAARTVKVGDPSDDSSRIGPWSRPRSSAASSS